MTTPATDCPPCPACTLTLGTPINLAEVDRWDGPEDATLYCPSCGAGWVGTAADVAQAERSWRAYVAEDLGPVRAVVEALTEESEPEAPAVDPRQMELL